MSRRQLVIPAVAAVCVLASPIVLGAGAAVPAPDAGATAHAAAAKRAHKPARRLAPLPTIRRVTPLKLAVGGTLTIVGRNFIPRPKRNTVVFLRNGAPAVFVKAGKATRTRLRVRITAKLVPFLRARASGAKRPTRFRLRILARRFGPRFTAAKLSPTILPPSDAVPRPQPAPGPAPAPVPTPPPPPACTLDGARANPDGDADGDGLPNGTELAIATDPCNADTDGDGISDGYEQQSALDLNSRALPYPGKRPYPNALDPSDAGVDYDGDGLTLADEHAAWVKYGKRAFPLLYSDGTQESGGPVAVTPATAWADLDGNGFLTDDEKDVDGDGLTNWDEAHGRMQPGWWIAVHKQERPYEVAYQPTDWLDPDTDGDGLVDGLDDVDHDGFTNAEEVQRGPYWVQPFNPCLPDWRSRTCALHPPIDDPYPPFGTGFDPFEPLPLAWPR